MSGAILTLNAGSSSVKCRLFDTQMNELSNISVSGIGTKPLFTAPDAAALELPQDTDTEQAITRIAQWVGSRYAPCAVAHRIVHGGTDYTQAIRLTPDIRAGLEKYIPLAPLHQPHNLAAIDIASRLFHGVPQIGCFDTAFHSGLTELHTRYALPDTSATHAIRRYGFHGLSYEWIALRLREDYPELYKGRVIAAHLGNGSSLCALREGKSIDTTMGMSALEGVPMGTRSGSIDPGALFYLLREHGFNADTLEHLLYYDSGLKGLSGISGDVRELLASSAPQAKFALDVFALKVAQHAMMLAVSLGGADAMVFTGGIGEHAAPVREAILGHLSFLPRLQNLVIPANEERIMAMQASALL